ncbi:hypothetical protein F4804DRAFT_81451 [Jackrogersella minutella]|nr:hypothetical protein F4804DRAFT_81451 [Jackrogersella minutella]
MWSFGTTMTMAKDSEPSPEKPLPPSQPPENTIPPPQPRPPILSQRSLKQLGLFFAGAGFLSLSTVITRRAVARQINVTIPKFFQQSNRAVAKTQSDSSLIAFEALSLATLNVMGFGIMTTGGLSWAFDISSMDDLRRMARRHIGPDGGRTDEEAEREIEEWIAKFMRKDQKEQQPNLPLNKEN